MNERYGYAYDAGGSLLRRTNSVSATTPLVQTFTVNDRNELTNVTRSGTLTVAGTSSSAATSVTVSANGGGATNAILYTGGTFARPGVSLNNGNNTFSAVGTDASGRQSTQAITVNLPSTVTFTYDNNGNLLSDGRRSFTYDDENQLLSVSVASAWKSEFAYDGLSRRRVRKEYAWQSGAWKLQEEIRYVYDGNLVLQERNGLGVPTATYTWGSDLSGSRQGAGGIGGLLARTEGLTPAFYHADGNGNITALINGAQWIAAPYLYDPYGHTLAQSGPLAEANLYRFSSKEAHPAAGLSYYLYRYYDPNLQRWLNRDPIQEAGGINMFTAVRNNPNRYVDLKGLSCEGTVKAGHGRSWVLPAFESDLEGSPGPTFYVGCGANYCNRGANCAGFGIPGAPRNRFEVESGDWPPFYNNGQSNPNSPEHGPAWPLFGDDDYVWTDDMPDMVNDAIGTAANSLCNSGCRNVIIKVECQDNSYSPHCGQSKSVDCACG